MIYGQAPRCRKSSGALVISELHARAAWRSVYRVPLISRRGGAKECPSRFACLLLAPATHYHGRHILPVRTHHWPPPPLFIITVAVEDIQKRARDYHHRHAMSLSANARSILRRPISLPCRISSAPTPLFSRYPPRHAASKKKRTARFQRRHALARRRKARV